MTGTSLKLLACALAVILGALAFGGCATKIGPKTIPGARFNYNEKIVLSRNEQLLLNLVRLRYRDTPLFLDIGSIVTQYQWGGRAGASPTVQVDGSSENQYGFDVGVEYAEQPTITYSPLQGLDFTQRLLTPVSPTTLILLSDSGWSIERLLLCCVQRVNNISNAPGAAGPTPDYVPDNEEFRRLASLLRSLQRAGVLQLQIDYSGEQPGTLLRLESSASGAATREALAEVRRMLSLAPGRKIFRLRSSGGEAGPGEIAIVGRSLLATLFFLSQSVDAPPGHEQQGLVTVTRDAQGQRFDWSRVTAGFLRIRSQAGPPPRAFARVRYRGHWFYIADDDLNSKTTFSLLTYLFSLQAAGAQGPSPLLTVPIGGR